MSDLIERLRGTHMAYTGSGNDAYVAYVTKEAADALEQLEAALQEISRAEITTDTFASLIAIADKALE